MLLSLFYAIVFFLHAVLLPGVNRIDGKHVKSIPAKIHKIAQMDSLIHESSALVKADSIFNVYYTLSDGGNKPCVFAINEKGEIIDVKTIPNSINKDWESLLFYKDSLDHPHLVIGDMGNNTSQRDDLCLYNYNAHTNQTVQHGFFYEDQEIDTYCPKKNNYDCEAFFMQGSSYFMLSKNWGNGPVRMYQLEQDTTAHVARVIQEMRMKGMITDCSFHFSKNRNRKELAVLLYGRIFLFELKETTDAIQLVPLRVIKFPTGEQTEGICWYSENELRVCNEKGKLFSVKINTKKFN